MGRGDGEKWGRGGRREAPQTLPSADPQPHHHGCHGGATATTAHGEGTAAAVSPSVARDLFGQPPFHFRISGGGGAPRLGVPSGGGAASPGTKPGGPHTGGGPPGGGWPCVGGVLSPLMGGGSDSGFSVTPPPRPSPRFGSLQAEATAVSPRGGWGGGTPQNRAPIAQPKGTPLPPPPSAQRRVPAPPGGDNLGVGDIKAGGVTMW